MSQPVHTTPEADGHILEIDDWWRKNRRASPELFVRELTASFEFIANTPQIGRPYRASPLAGTRRLLLKETRYHVYYLPRRDDVIVLAI